MPKKRSQEADELIFHAELPNEDYLEEDPSEEDFDMEPKTDEEEEDIPHELEIDKNGHIIQPHRRGHSEDDEDPITIWNEE